jgi:hypothetical protein
VNIRLHTCFRIISAMALRESPLTMKFKHPFDGRCWRRDWNWNHLGSGFWGLRLMRNYFILDKLHNFSISFSEKALILLVFFLNLSLLVISFLYFSFESFDNLLISSCLLFQRLFHIIILLSFQECPFLL